MGSDLSADCGKETWGFSPFCGSFATHIRNRKIKGRIETKNEVCHNVYGTHGELP